jgi:selenide,water dikinase
VELGRLLDPFKGSDDPNLLVGLDTSDDAGVYRVREDLALVQTVDLITPVCDDPVIFGRVAAANALSDVYAMGGRPLTALNICCFPAEGVPEGVLADILRGAREVLAASGTALLGGHTVRDNELKYGLAVTGTIHPRRILANAGARPGDALVLTKPLGSGVVVNGARKDRITWEKFLPILEQMATLNDTAAELALSHGAHAATDITGFGMAGHTLEVARASGVRMRLWAGALPLYDGALEMVAAGVSTVMTPQNRKLAQTETQVAAEVPADLEALLYDPQTSGGLLISLPAARADALVEALRARGVQRAARVGEVLAGSAPLLEVTA